MSDKPPMLCEVRFGAPIALADLLSYEADTGKLFWIRRPESMFNASDGKIRRSAAWAAAKWNTRFAGQEALTRIDKCGYRTGSIFGRDVKAHRIAWALYYGEMPTGSIDHINGDPGDNRIANLRDVSHAENMRNQRRQLRSASGVTGVHWSKASSKWSAEIVCNGEKQYLGLFTDFDAAIEARRDAQRRLGFHENHGREL